MNKACGGNIFSSRRPVVDASHYLVSMVHICRNDDYHAEKGVRGGKMHPRGQKVVLDTQAGSQQLLASSLKISSHPGRPGKFTTTSSNAS